MHQYGDSRVDLYIVRYAESLGLDTAVRAEAENTDRGLRPESEVSRAAGDVEDTAHASEERAGTQRPHYAMPRRQRRKYKTACLGPAVRDGLEEEPNGDSQEADGAHGQSRRHYVSRRIALEDHTDLLTEQLSVYYLF